MRVRIVAADRGEARFYDMQHLDSPLQEVGKLSDPKAHLRDREFSSDRPGRVFDHASTGARRGAVAHHATGGENSPKRHEAELFARRIAEVLARAQQDHEFDRLVLMAGPAFLGELRAAISKPLSSVVVAEIDKDLMHESEDAISAHLPRTVFMS